MPAVLAACAISLSAGLSLNPRVKHRRSGVPRQAAARIVLSSPEESKMPTGTSEARCDRTAPVTRSRIDSGEGGSAAGSVSGKRWNGVVRTGPRPVTQAEWPGGNSRIPSTMVSGRCTAPYASADARAGRESLRGTSPDSSTARTSLPKARPPGVSAT